MFGSSSNTFDPEKDIPSLTGKVFVLTGGSAGIGQGIAAHILSHKPAALYILSRKPEHLTDATSFLSKYGDTSVVHTVQCDLSSVTATHAVAQKLVKDLPRLDVLILNAGLGVGPYNLTPEDLDSHMAVNHIAQFHLALTLLPLLIAQKDSRLVLQSSEFHRFDSSSRFESLSELNRDIGPSNLYGRTKLAQILFVRALAERKSKGELGMSSAADQGPWIIATHPGGVKTDQQDQAVDAYGTLGKIGVKAVRPFLKDPIDEGCRPALFAATSEDVVREKLQGVYIVPDRKVSDPSKHAQDRQVGENLWKLTEEILKERIGEKLPYATTYV